MAFILGFLTGVLYGGGLAWLYSQYRQSVRTHERNKDLATGTPIASELAREMGLKFKWNK